MADGRIGVMTNLPGGCSEEDVEDAALLLDLEAGIVSFLAEDEVLHEGFKGGVGQAAEFPSSSSMNPV